MDLFAFYRFENRELFAGFVAPRVSDSNRAGSAPQPATTGKSINSLAGNSGKMGGGGVSSFSSSASGGNKSERTRDHAFGEYGCDIFPVGSLPAFPHAHIRIPPVAATCYGSSSVCKLFHLPYLQLIGLLALLVRLSDTD